MTFDQRVQALASLRLTDRQTRFLVTVALHSGYCLRRQYLAFAGVRYGKNVRDFLDGLVRRGLALRFTYRLDRGHVYHVHARALYRALQQEDNRNRRVASPALIARKLMLLDAVLSEPDAAWYATEADKVDLFTSRYGVEPADLPQHPFETDDEGRPHPRYFVRKLPIYLAGDPVVPHFVYLASDTSTEAFAQFLRDHRPLLGRLPGWAVVIVKPAHVPDLPDHATVFWQVLRGEPGACDPHLGRLFAIQRLVEEGHLSQVSVADLHRYREARHLLTPRRMRRLYAAWLADGDAGVASPAVGSAGVGALLIRTLPHAYEQFGSMAGVA
jgi:hypothetical protein